MIRPADAATTPYAAFQASHVRVGDVVRYPATLRPEHHGRRTERLLVAGVDERGLRCIQKVNGDKHESFVTTRQLEDNGVVVEAHVGD